MNPVNAVFDAQAMETLNEDFRLRCDREVNKRREALRIPEWLNEEATALGLNFSQILQEALMQKIGIR